MDVFSVGVLSSLDTHVLAKLRTTVIGMAHVHVLTSRRLQDLQIAAACLTCGGTSLEHYRKPQ